MNGFKIFLFITVFGVTVSQLGPTPGIYVDRVSLSSASTTSTYYSQISPLSLTPLANNTYSFTVLWKMTLPAVVSSGIGLQHFNMGPVSPGLSILSYKASLASTTISGTTISLSCIDSYTQFLYVGFSIIIVTQSNNLIELINYTYSFAKLNQSIRSVNSQIFKPQSLKFIFSSTLILGHFVMLQWATCGYNQSTQELGFTHTLLNGTPYIQITVSSAYNVYSQMAVTILLINLYAFEPNIAAYSYYHDFIPIPTVSFPTDFGVPANFGVPAFDSKCIIGLSYVDMIPSSQSYIYFSFSGQQIVSTIYSSTKFTVGVGCTAQCPVGTFINPLLSTVNCLACSSAITDCQSCLSSTMCTQCIPPMLLAFDGSSCTTCASHMQNCDVCVSPTTCTSCIVPSVLVTGGCTTLANCIAVQQSTYTDRDATSVCILCGVDSSLQQLFLQSGLTTQTCKSTCQINYLIDTFNNVFNCDKCDIACYTCSSPSSSTHCITCNNFGDYFLAFGSVNSCTQCLSTQTAVGNPLECTPCSTNCLTCQNSITNCTSCDQYTNGTQLYLDKATNTCVLYCPINYYDSTTLHICDECNIACLYCYAQNLSTSCNSCNNMKGYVLAYNKTSSCVLGCPIGQYSTGLPLACQLCSTNCLTCSGSSTACTSCGVSVLGGQLYLTPSSTCVFFCPQSTYANSTSNKCISCDVSCINCFGPLYNQCTRCSNLTDTNNVTTIYYLTSGQTICSSSCPNGQFIDVTIPNYCQLCNALCVYCLGTSTNCTGAKCEVGYYFYNNFCYSVCPAGSFPDSVLMQCIPCTAGCLTCTSGGLLACKSCTNVINSMTNVTTVYYLNYGATVCSKTCPNGQYGTANLNQCFQCTANCSTCKINSSYCLTCSTNSANISVFLFNYTCSSTCPINFYQNSTNVTDRRCSPCNSACSVCFNSLITTCTECKNVMIASTLHVYYKDANLNSCLTSCSLGQYVSGPNTCSNCASGCSSCVTNSSNCQSCSSSYYLDIPNSLCVSHCPNGFYNDLLFYSTYNSKICSPCLSICLTCTGPTFNQCLSCNNITISGITTNYFLQPSSTICDLTCPTGYFPNQTSNACQVCQNGCVACSFSASNCSACEPYAGISYFLDDLSNSCVTYCPNAGFANLTDYTCQICRYFVYGGQCLQSCPTGLVGVISNVSTCVVCQSSNTSCNKVLGFGLSTQVANNGQNFKHIVELPQGLASNITAGSLSDGLFVELVIGGTSRRLLLQVVVLSVQSLSINSGGYSLAILTNYYPADISTARVSVSFRAGALVSSNGTVYNQLTSAVSLNSPSYISSYISVFSNLINLQVEGIIFVLISFLVLLASVFLIKDQKFRHESLAFIQLIQIIGLSRIRPFPFEFDFYNTLKGFSCFELLFIPNGLANIYPDLYTEVSIDSVVYSLGSQNFIIGFGSILEIFVPLQIILAIYYLFIRGNEEKVKKYKIIQENLIMLWSIIIVYGASLCVLSTEINTISSDNLLYAFTVAFSFGILISYCAYFVYWVKNNLQNQLYKIQNLVRVLGLLLLTYGHKDALLFLNAEEVLFFVIEMTMYKESKTNKLCFVIQSIGCLLALNSTFMMVNQKELVILLAIVLTAILLIKFFYMIKIILEPLKVQDKVNDADEKIQQKNIPFGSDLKELQDESIASVIPEKQQKAGYFYDKKMTSHSTLIDQSSLVLDQKIKEAPQQHQKNQYNPDPEVLFCEMPQEMRVSIRRRKRKQLQPIEVRHKFQIQDEKIQVINLENSVEEGSEKIQFGYLGQICEE